MDGLGHAAIGQLSWVPVAAESEAGRNLEWRIGTKRSPISINPTNMWSLRPLAIYMLWSVCRIASHSQHLTASFDSFVGLQGC